MTPLPARYEGMQEWPGHASFALWTILADIPGHPAHSTMSLNTLHKLGYEPTTQEVQDDSLAHPVD